jgi:chromosome segregation ATPase
MEDEANRFIDDVYAPAYIKKFAGEFKLEKVVKSLAGSDDPEDLLKTMVRFVSKAYEVIAEKRAELVDPIKDQRKQVVNDIDTSHRQLQAAQAVISGHIASVRKVQDVQNELLSKVGLEGVREKVAEKTAEVSSRIAGYIKEAEKAEGQMDTIENALTKIKEAIDDLKEKDHE